MIIPVESRKGFIKMELLGGSTEKEVAILEERVTRSWRIERQGPII